ncbi:hypothetical protein L0F63_007285 [Massospora cicadina]|nr:hypothetical protein L0F63_007285 [Massospora cicadina]
MDSKQLRMDLENLQTFSKNGKDLANGNYIQEQLALLSNFEVEIQHFLTPQWSLTGVPYVAFYFGLKIPLEHRRDFIVLPFSGEASDLRLLTTSPTLESCSLYNHHVRGRAVVIPYPSSKTHGISMPCPVWDLAYSAQEAGAAAVVLYLQGIDAEFPNFDGLHPALLPPGWRLGGRMIEIPVILLNRVSGELLRSVPFSIDIKVSVSFSLHVSKNIIAKQKLRHHPPHLNPAHQPILIGAHWDSDPLTLNASHFKVTGAAGLLAAARAIDAAAFRLETHPVELVWFGARSPLRLGLLKYLDSLEESTLHPYFYFDLGRLEGERPCQFDIKEIPPTHRQISAKAQRSMNDTIRYGFGHSSKGPIPNPPLYRYDGTLGVPEMTFVEYGVPATGISSSFLANSTNSQVEMVLQLTKVVLIAVDAITKRHVKAVVSSEA